MPASLARNVARLQWLSLGPLHDPVTWYGINYTGTQITQWDFQNKGRSGWTGASSSVLEVPLRHLRPSAIYSVPCDRIVQRAYLPRFQGARPDHVQVQSSRCCCPRASLSFDQWHVTRSPPIRKRI